MFSNSLPLSLYRSGLMKSEEDQKEYQFRLKPVRKDYPIADIYPSLSCSDKLLKWTLCGVQGKYLSQVMHSVYLSKLVLPLASCQQHSELLKKISNSLKLKKRIQANPALQKQYKKAHLRHWNWLMKSKRPKLEFYESSKSSELKSLSVSIVYSAAGHGLVIWP